jgi:hypothetical protein
MDKVSNLSPPAPKKEKSINYFEGKEECTKYLPHLRWHSKVGFLLA